MTAPKCLRKMFCTKRKEKENVASASNSITTVTVVSQSKDKTSKILGYNDRSRSSTFTVDKDPTLSLKHAGFKGKTVDIANLPCWTWTEEKCQDWISEFATTHLRMNSWQGGKAGKKFVGTGRVLYCTTKEEWNALLGTEKIAGVMYEFLVKASKEKGVMPRGVVIGHQTSLKG